MNAQLLQLLISLGGVALMVGLCRVLFGRSETSLADIEAVSESLARNIPGFRAGATTLSRDMRSALIENLQDRHIYLAVVRGDGLVTRRLAQDVQITRASDCLELEMKDFTLPKAELKIPGANAWEMKLRGAA